jgi:hypothetical protein
MNLLIPAGYLIYTGADISAVVDAEGSIFWSCQAHYPDGRFGQIVVKQTNGEAEVIPLPEFVTGRGQLNYSPVGLFLSVWNETAPKTPKLFQISQYKQPAIINAIETVVLPAARWIGDPNVPYELTDDLIRTKLRLSDTLLNAIREALIKNKLGA